MSVQVSKLVWEYGPRVVAQRFLLLALAEHADDEGKAFPGIEVLCSKVLKDQRTVLRQLARLEREGWLKVQRRTAGVLCSNGLYERRGATYLVNLDKLRGATRTAGEKSTSTGQRDAAAGVSGREAKKETPNGQRKLTVAGASQQDEEQEREASDCLFMPVETDRRDDKTAEPKCQNVQPEMTKTAPRDDISCAPLMNHQEPPRNHHEKYNYPQPPSSDAQLWKSKDASQEQRPKATASAKATATTPVLRAPGVSTESVGGAGREFGRDVALEGEARAVLIHCGVPPEISTRRERLAVEAALRMEAVRTGRDLATVAHEACSMWTSYVHARHLLWRRVGVREFFAQGYWLEHGRAWDWNESAIAEKKRAMGSRIGMTWSN